MQLLHQIQRIVLVADNVIDPGVEMTIYNRDLDKPDIYYVRQLSDSIISCGYEVVLYHLPSDFLNNIHLHNSDLIFPYWFGENSRNRHSLIPAICEAAGLMYVGADAYTKIVCNDKQLSKLLCRQVNLSTPDFYIWNSESDDSLLNELHYPCVVKPNFEGTSLGISSENLVTDSLVAKNLTEKLYREFNQPIIIEEFAPGKEVSICLIGLKGKIKIWTAAERYMKDDDKFFINNLYTFKDKKAEPLLFNLRPVESEINNEILENCTHLFKYLDKVEFMRIDGRLLNGNFSVIELTPETHLGDDAEFCGTFISTGKYNYNQVINLLIQNCLEGYQNQNANR